MNKDWQQRTTLLLGDEKIEKLNKSNILIVGLGGVGSWAAEMLCRAGVGNLTLIDADMVDATNINRQMPATHKSVGSAKTEITAQRLLDINPGINIIAISEFLDENNIPMLLKNNHYDYVVDAIDSLVSKASLIKTCWELNIRIISSLGAGAKSDLSTIKESDLWKTEHCQLGKSLRQMLKDYRGKPLPVIFSNSAADKNAVMPNPKGGKPIIGTVSYFTAAFGGYLTQHVIKNL